MENSSAQQVVLRSPAVPDARSIWKLARDSARADSNSAYFYLLWCRDFAGTSVVAMAGDRLAGFLLGYLRQDFPDTLVVWQDGVAPASSVSGLRLRMLNDVIARNLAHGINFVETTVTPQDKAIIRVVKRVARLRDTGLARHVLFAPGHFPDDHQMEILYSIGPLGTVRH